MSSTVTDLPRRHRLTVRDYYRMAVAGILLPNERVELIEGEIIDMAPIGSRHAGTVDQLTRILLPAVGGSAILRIQGPVSLGEYSEPEPDLALLRPRADFYKSAHPRSADVLLVVEVADTSLQYDRNVKVPLYARHGVSEVWVVDIENGRLTRCREPQDGAYARTDWPDVGAPVEIAGLAGLSVDLSGVFAG